MSRFTRLRGRLLVLARSERGMALPTALFATVASLALSGAAVMSSIDVQRGSKRDNGTKSAIGAADAGANVAMMRLARDASELATESCLDGADPVAGWCPPVDGEVGGSVYSYRISEAGVPCAGGTSDLCVVATGAAAGATRRILVTFDQGLADPTDGSGKEDDENGSGSGGDDPGSGPEGLIGVEDVIVEENADVRVSMGTNGNVRVENNGNVCGNIRHGIGKKPIIEAQGTQCPGYKITEANVTLPSVESFMPADIATNNSNYRLVACTKTTPVPVPTGCQLDTYTGSWKNGGFWNSTTKTISTSNNSTLTLGGGDYFICRLALNNGSHLVMAAGATVRIFFDTPEHCGLTSGTKQIYIDNNANITSTGYQPKEGQFDMPGLFVTGSTKIPTTIEWKQNSGTNEFVLYAPNSDIVLQNNATFKGTIAGKTVHLINKAIVEHDPGFKVPPELNPWHEEEVDPGEDTEEDETDGVVVFTPQFYVECSNLVSSAPDAGC